MAVLHAIIGLYLLGSTLLFGQVWAASPALTDEYKLFKVGHVEWSTCTGDGVVPGAECGFAIVPLDYFNASAGVAKIALGRYNATSGKKKGSVFLNPGGPGGPGVSLATSSGPDFQQIIGKEYDMIGFDPRGIGQTEPVTQCFPSPEARQAFIANTVLDRGYDVSPNVSDPANRYHLIQTQRDANALYKTQFEICAQTMGDGLRYMGTSTVVRDIVFITSLLEGKDALVNFYGLSYGTAIGAYLVNMFPDRVGHVVIDGVLDAVDWSSVPSYKWERDFLVDTDNVYKLFMSECAKAGPSQCALAKHANDTGDAVLARLESFINNLYFQPLAVPNADIPGILTSGRTRLYIMGALVSPMSWPNAAAALAQAMAGNGTAVLNSVNTKDLKDLERSAVSCNDNKPFAPPTPEEVIDEQLYDTEHVSRFSLTVVISEPDAGCQFWPVTPPERFLGPWNHTLRNPMLIISNTLDPATPLASGKRALKRQGKKSAGLLVQDGPGHTSFALPSLCTAQHVRTYFANGTLPAEGTVCPVDVLPFESHSSGVHLAMVATEDMKTLESLTRIKDALFG
ncbi:hypothetical protein BV20DRAFT_991265 [Pilatotrama ljubarskyi]|nr:hypothetical protein BV20DRAFT_991265 [Pilatotrama ljubarskyi]